MCLNLSRLGLGKSSCGFCWTIFFFTLVDAYSNGIDAQVMNSTSVSANTVHPERNILR